jgi:hypothetical protein
MPSEQTESRLPRMEKSLTWKMGILETLHRDAITVALIEGHPRDFLDLMGEQRRRDYLIISRSGRKFSLDEPPDSLPLLALLKNPRSDLVNWDAANAKEVTSYSSSCLSNLERPSPPSAVQVPKPLRASFPGW